MTATALEPGEGQRSAPMGFAPARSKGRAGRVVLRIALLVVSLVTLFPLYWMVSSSVKTPEELQTVPQAWLPLHITFSAYSTVFKVVSFGRGIVNSMLFASIATIAVLVTSTMAAYVFAKYKFRGRDALFWTLVATTFMPPIVTLVPLYWLVTDVGLSDSYLGVLLPWLANAFGIFLLRQFIISVPDEIIEAARVDGASEFRIVWQIITPVIKPGIATLAVFSFVYYWNNFLWPLTILQSSDKYPITLTLNGLLSYSSSVQYENVVMAGSLIASVPTLVIFALAQRTFVQGIASTGVKG